MWTAALVLIVLGVAVALWSAARHGRDAPVDEQAIGGINAYDAYYGKNRWDWGASPPCEVCGREGCVGSGNCRCKCHKPHSKTRSKK